MSTEHETGRGQLGSAKRDTGQPRALADEPRDDQLDSRQERMGTRRRGPLSRLLHDPDAPRALDEAEVADTPPTDCAEPPEDEDATPQGPAAFPR